MRGSMFVANPWARQPLRPIVTVRLAQAQTCPINAAPGECPLEKDRETPPTSPDPTQQEAYTFPIAPVAVGAGALLLAALLF